MSVDSSATALRVHVRRAIDSEPPFERDVPPTESHPRVIGSLALATDRPTPAETAPAPRRLELVQTRPTVLTGQERDELFDVVRTSRAELPPPGPRAGVLVRAIMEVLTGRRPVTQLVRWATTDVYEELEVSVAPPNARGWAARLLRLIVTEPADGVAEVTAVVQNGRRAIALALRLEGRDGRWVITALETH